MITRIQKSIYMRFMSILMLFSLLCYTNQNLFAKAPVAVESKDFFKALFFLDGELLNKTPNLKMFKIDNLMTNEADIAKYRENVSIVLAQIEKSDPTFFNTFAKEVTSGNQLRIKSAMELGSKKMEMIHKENLSLKPKSKEYTRVATDFKNYLIQKNVPARNYTEKADAVRGYIKYLGEDADPNKVAATIVIVTVAIALYLAVITFAVAVDVVFWDGTETGKMFNGNSFVNDEIVNEIAVNFNGAY